MSGNEYTEWGFEADWVPKLMNNLDLSRLNSLDSKTGYLISRVDGVTALSDVCMLSGLGLTESLSRLAQLTDQGIIEFDHLRNSPPPSPAKSIEKNRPPAV